MNNDALIQLCRKKIAQKLAMPDYTNWRHETYLLLSKDLFEQTKIAVSPDTLKRFFGKRAPTLPQLQTRNALVQYLGYTDWVSFARQHDNQNLNSESLMAPKKTSKLWFYIASVLVILCFGYWVYNQVQPSQMVSLQATNTQGTVPLYVNYSILGLSASVTKGYELHLGYNDWLSPYPVSVITLGSGVTAYNESYQIPDYHLAKLQSVNGALDSVYIYATKNEWVGLAGFPFRYFEPYPIVYGKGYITHDSAQLMRAGLNRTQHYISEFRYYYPISISGDHFEANIELMLNEQTGGKSCYDVFVEMECANGTISTQFVEPGCEKYAHFEFSEIRLDGRYANLSSFGHTFFEREAVQLHVDSNAFQIRFGAQQHYTGKYKKALGAIKGIRVRFKGIGNLYEVYLHDLVTGTRYNTHF